jgi:hypothetical protein
MADPWAEWRTEEPAPTVPSTMPSWKVSPEEQAARDALARQVRELERTNPEYGGSDPTLAGIEEQVRKVSGSSKTVSQRVGDATAPIEVKKDPWASWAEEAQPVKNEDQTNDPWAEWKTPETPAEKPSTLKVIGQKVLSAAEEAEYLARGASAGIYGLFSKDLADEGFKRAEERKEKVGTALLSREEQSKASMAQNVAGDLASMVLPLGVATKAPKVVLGLMAAISDYSTATELLKQNVDLARAEAAGATKAAGTLATAWLPGFSQTVAGTFGWGVVANPVQGAITDYAIHSLFPDRPEIQKQFDPLDPEKRVSEAVTGGVIGFTFRGLTEAHRKAEVSRQLARELHTELLEGSILKDLDGIVGPGKIARHTGQTLEDLYKRGKVTQEPDPADPTKTITVFHPSYSVKDVLDLATESSDASTYQKAVSRGLSRLAVKLGLHEVPVQRDDTLPAKGRYIPDGVTASQKNPNHPEDSLVINTKLHNNSADLVRTSIHESAHAIFSNLGNVLEFHSRNAKGEWHRTATQQVVDPVLGKLLDRTEKFSDLFKKGKEKWLDSLGETDPNIRARLMADDKPFFEAWLYNKKRDLQNRSRGATPEEIIHLQDTSYGWMNYKEFVSEILSSPTFAKSLKDLQLDPVDITLSKRSEPHTIKYFWNEVKRAFNELVGLPTNDSFYDVALDHVTGILDTHTPGNRGSQSKAWQANQKAIKDNFDMNAKTLSKVFVGRISKLLQVSATKDELMMRLNAQSTNKAWRYWVAENLEALWDNPYQVIDVAAKTDFNKLSPEEKRLLHDDRTVDQFFAEEFTSYLDEGKVTQALQAYKDLKSIGTYLFSPQVLNLMKTTEAAKLMKYMNNKSREYKSMSDVLYHDAIAHFQDFNSLERASSLELMNTISKFDKPKFRKQLQDSGLQWIPDDLLRAEGVSDEAINAYHSLTKGEEFIFSLLNQTRAKRGQAPLEMIPGYMPHVFPGAYKVMIEVIKPSGNPHKSDDRWIVEVKGYNFRQQAENLVERLASGKYDHTLPNGQTVRYRAVHDNQTNLDYKIRKHKDLKSTLMADIQEQQTAYHSLNRLDPQFIQKLEEIESDNIRGFSKHALERSDVKGYYGGEGVKNSILERFGIGDPYNNKLLKLWQNYAKDVVDYYTNTMWESEVFNPMTQARPMEIGGQTHYGVLLENTSNIKKHMAEFSANFTGENINNTSFIDNAAQALSIKIGVDPLLYRSTVRSARNLLSLVKLRINPRNYAANFIQPVHTLGILEMANELLRQGGMSTKDLPSPTASMLKAIKNRFSPDEDMAMALYRTKQEHHLDAQLDYELGIKQLSPMLDLVNKLTLGNVTTGIESMSRGTSFMMAYEHFRQIYKGDSERARGAAIQAMEMTMVNYNRESRPMMYQNFGVVGEALSPFAVFRNGYIGNTFMMAKIMKANPASLKPFVFSQMVYLATAGMSGIIGAAEINMIVNFLNNHFPELGLPTLEELMFKAGWSDAVVYGALSSWTKNIPGLESGVYVGSSLNAVGGDDVFSSAIVPFVGALASVVGLGAREAMSQINDSILPPTKSDWHKPVKQLLPGIFHAPYEKSLMYPGSDVAPKSANLSGGVERNQSDWNALIISGGRGLRETRESAENRIVAQKEKARKETVKDVIEMGVDHAMGLKTTWSYVKIAKRAQELGVPYEDFIKKVVEGREKRLVSQRLQDLRKRTYEGIQEQQDIRDMTGK